MLLPDSDSATIDPAKLRDYLLSPTHPIGASNPVCTGLGSFRTDGGQSKAWRVESEDFMFSHPLTKPPFVQGLYIGLAFGVVNLVFTCLSPLTDDTAAAVLRFYGPMFFLWALVAFAAARRTGRLLSGVAAGAVVAFGTFCVFEVFALLRVNLFLRELTGRPDWQNMMLRFRASEFDSLRVWVNLDYLKGAPLKLGVAAFIGAMMGTIGGSVSRLGSPANSCNCRTAYLDSSVKQKTQ